MEEEEDESESESEDDDEKEGWWSTWCVKPAVFLEVEGGVWEEDEEGEVEVHLASGLRRNVSLTLGGGLS